MVKTFNNLLELSYYIIYNKSTHEKKQEQKNKSKLRFVCLFLVLAV